MAGVDENDTLPHDIGGDERREFRHMGIHCVHQGLRRASRITARLYDRAFASYGLTGVQFSLLLILASSSRPMSIQELARNTSTERTTLTRDLRIIEERGWILPVAHADKRRRLMAISPTGAQILKQAQPAWRETQARLTRILGESEWEQARRSVRKLIRRGPALLEES